MSDTHQIINSRRISNRKRTSNGNTDVDMVLVKIFALFLSSTKSPFFVFICISM